MRQTPWVMSLVALGVAVRVASGFVDTQPAFALIVIAAVLGFGAFSARPSRS